MTREIAVIHCGAAGDLARGAVFAVGGPGYAESGVRAVFAKTAANADRIDGIHASRSPRPNRLLPLNAAGKFPASVLTLSQGPKGDAGPGGATGPQGPAGSDATLAGVSAGGALAGTYPDPQLAAPEQPAELTFLNGWHDYGLAYNAARYYKDPLGIAHLSGAMSGGTLHAPAFDLPAGYRPSGIALFGVLSAEGVTFRAAH